MKKYIMAAAALLMAAGSYASDYKLQVNLKDGKSVEFDFAAAPLATFENSDMTIKVNGQDKYTYVIADVENMKITGTGTGIGKATLAGRPSFRIEGGILSGKGTQAGARITIYDTGGALAASATADETGAFSVAIDSLPKGVYVVNATGIQFKFIK